MEYLLVLFLYAVRVTAKVEFGTRVNASGPGCVDTEQRLSDAWHKWTYEIDDFTEMNLHTALMQIRVLSGVVYELWEFSLSHLGGTVSEHEEQRIDGIGFARTIGPDDCRERLPEISDDAMGQKQPTLWKGPISWRPA
jgi:hypothetical protein